MTGKDEPGSSISRGRRLEGWKEITGYLGDNLSSRTAQRWETNEKLPIFREGKKVFAFTGDIDEWRLTRVIPPPGTASEVVGDAEDYPDPQRLAPQPSSGGVGRRSKRYAVGAGLAAVLVLFAFLFVWRKGEWAGRGGHEPAPPGRLLALSTTQGRASGRIQIKKALDLLELSRDGSELYGVPFDRHSLSIVNVLNGQERIIEFPNEIRSLTAASRGVVYLGSDVDGVTRVETNGPGIATRSIPTGGRVWDVAATPDGEKLFLALGYAGLKRLSTRTGKISTLSIQPCPIGLAVDSAGKRLYVAYQCAGPGPGRRGHDSVEVFDTVTESSLGFASGPPMVGTRPLVFPDGRTILLDARDACFDPKYGASGCPSFPSRLFHLLRTSDLTFVNLAVTYPLENAPAAMLDNARVVMIGGSLAVIHATRRQTIERLRTPKGQFSETVYDPIKRRLYTALQSEPTILTFQAEGPECEWDPRGVIMRYPFDGVSDDAVGQTSFNPTGDVTYTEGRVGQAIGFSGRGFLSETWAAGWGFLGSEATLALYVAPRPNAADAVILEWQLGGGTGGIRLSETASHRFVFEAWPGRVRLVSKTVASPDVWYHLAITGGKKLSLYVNGAIEAIGDAPKDSGSDGILTLGADASGGHSLSGKIDEVTFYNRALSAEEIKAMYKLREKGACRL